MVVTEGIVQTVTPGKYTNWGEDFERFKKEPGVQERIGAPPPGVDVNLWRDNAARSLYGEYLQGRVGGQLYPGSQEIQRPAQDTTQPLAPSRYDIVVDPVTGEKTILGSKKAVELYVQRETGDTLTWWDQTIFTPAQPVSPRTVNIAGQMFSIPEKPQEPQIVSTPEFTSTELAYGAEIAKDPGFQFAQAVERSFKMDPFAGLIELAIAPDKDFYLETARAKIAKEQIRTGTLLALGRREEVVAEKAAELIPQAVGMIALGGLGTGGKAAQTLLTGFGGVFIAKGTADVITGMPKLLDLSEPSSVGRGFLDIGFGSLMVHSGFKAITKPEPILDYAEVLAIRQEKVGIDTHMFEGIEGIAIEKGMTQSRQAAATKELIPKDLLLKGELKGDRILFEGKDFLISKTPTGAGISSELTDFMKFEILDTRKLTGFETVKTSRTVKIPFTEEIPKISEFKVDVIKPSGKPSKIDFAFEIEVGAGLKAIKTAKAPPVPRGVSPIILEAPVSPMTGFTFAPIQLAFKDLAPKRKTAMTTKSMFDMKTDIDFKMEPTTKRATKPTTKTRQKLDLGLRSISMPKLSPMTVQAPKQVQRQKEKIGFDMDFFPAPKQVQRPRPAAKEPIMPKFALGGFGIAGIPRRKRSAPLSKLRMFKLAKPSLGDIAFGKRGSLRIEYTGLEPFRRVKRKKKKKKKRRRKR